MITALLCRSIAGIVSSSENSSFQDEALKIADSSLEDLPIKIQAGIVPFLLGLRLFPRDIVPLPLFFKLHVKGLCTI